MVTYSSWKLKASYQLYVSYLLKLLINFLKNTRDFLSFSSYLILECPYRFLTKDLDVLLKLEHRYAILGECPPKQ